MERVMEKGVIEKDPPWLEPRDPDCPPRKVPIGGNR